MKKLRLIPAAQKMVDHFEVFVSDSVKDVISRIPRDQFVPINLRSLAYSDQALGIGQGQTISQPSLVAIMTDLLGLTGKEKVLEVGTGSGYQAAILSQLAKKVISVEYDRQLAAAAELSLMKLGVDNVTIVVGDGSVGYSSEAAYEAIIVTAAAPEIPEPLIKQLQVGGRLIIPVGSRTSQQLLQVVKSSKGLKTTEWGPVQFVPLLGKYGWPE